MTDNFSAQIAKPGVSRFTISVTVMLTTIMVILDMTIVNVALPNMMGTLGANTDQITWVLTSYIVVEAITIPLTGFFVKMMGRRNLMMMSAAGFITMSALCGFSENLTEMIIFRTFQGFFGAFVIPLSQSIMVDVFPKDERGKAMAIWGIGIMAAPILGPTIGGYITDHWGWEWVFYINFPVGILNLFMIYILLLREKTQKVKVDWIGVFFMALGIGALQYTLDRGNQENWFDSRVITYAAMISASALIYFVYRSWNRQDSVVNLQLLKDRNLATASFLIFIIGLGMFGTIALQPILLEDLMGYPASTAGLVMAPRGFGAIIGMFIVSKFIGKVDLRKIVITGLVISAVGSYYFSILDLNAAVFDFVWPSVIQGLGIGMIFVPLSTLAYETLSKAQSSEAAGIFNVFRSIGSSAGISVAVTLLTRANDMSRDGLSRYFTPDNPEVTLWLKAQRLSLNDPLAITTLTNELSKQAYMIAFVDAFWAITLSFIIMIPLVFIIKNPSKVSN